MATGCCIGRPERHLNVHPRERAEKILRLYILRLCHECRHLGIIGLTLRHHFRLFEFLFQLLCQCLQVSVVIEDMPETELVDQYHQQVFGHDEFMSVFLAAVNGLFQDGGCSFGLFDLCHFLLLVWFYG